MNKRERMYQQIEEHGENLKKIFKLDVDAVKLSKKLFSLENKAHRLSTQYCNGDIDAGTWDTETGKILAKVDKITGYKEKGLPVFINGDCRGYALKLRSEFAYDKNIYRDMGGFGILAPNFNN